MTKLAIPNSDNSLMMIARLSHRLQALNQQIVELNRHRRECHRQIDKIEALKASIVREQQEIRQLRDEFEARPRQ